MLFVLLFNLVSHLKSRIQNGNSTLELNIVPLFTSPISLFKEGGRTKKHTIFCKKCKLYSRFDLAFRFSSPLAIFLFLRGASH